MRQHITGRGAANAFRYALPPEFSSTPPAEGDDYGWDFIVLTGRDGYMEYHFFAQVKGAEPPEYLADGEYLSHDFEVPTLLWLLAQPFPTMLGVCDTAADGTPVYWEWLDRAIERVTALRGDAWRDQGTVALHIPLANRLTHAVRDRIADDVVRAIHAQPPAVALPPAPAPPASARPRALPPDYVPWVRFWGPLTVEPQLDDDYLLDPIRFGPYANTEARTLEQLADQPCLILLGPMGMGKSTTIDDEVARTVTAGAPVLAFDLLEFETAEALAQAWFASDAWRGFLTGAGLLTVVLDSVDEMGAPLPAVIRHVRERLRGVDVSRLRLRGVCRSGAWPPALETLLRELYGDAVEVRTLWPLRRSDVLAAAVQVLGPDAAEEFLRTIARRDVRALAGRPTTLRFLLEAFRASGSLPTAPSDLYREGCLRLCADDQIRIRSGPAAAARFTPRQRTAVAAAIAVIGVLTGRRLLLRHDPALPVDGCLSPRDVVALRVDIAGAAIVVDEHGYAEALMTGLFAPAGEGRLRWGHASYADFLAALALAERPLNMLRDVIVSADGAGTFIPPQLRELAVWLAELRPELLLTDLLPLDPLLAVQGAARAPDAIKRAIVDQWLEGIRTGGVHVPIGIFGHYAKLRHPGLARQLLPLVEDRTRAPYMRRIASDIAEACELVELQPIWVRMALDATEPHEVRVAAADALVRLGDAGAKAALEPLARGNAGDDPDDDLRGFGLMAVYPGRWDLKTVLAHLPPAQQEDYLGYYELFVSDVLPSKLGVDDLPVILQAAPAWLTRRVAFPELIAKITAAAWPHLGRADVAQALARLLAARVRADQSPFSDD